MLHLPRWPRTLPGGGPAQAASARHGKDLQPVCQDHTEIRGGRKETWDTHVLLEPPGAHRAGGDRCLTATTPAEVQSSLRGNPTSWVGSSTLHAMRRETQLKRHESWQKEVYRVAESVGAGSGESRGAEEGIWWDVPAAQGVTRGTEMSTYWPPCHVSASKEIATDGVPVHPAGRLGGEKISTEHPFPTNPDKAPRKQETKSPRQEAKRQETRDN